MEHKLGSHQFGDSDTRSADGNGDGDSNTHSDGDGDSNNRNAAEGDSNRRNAGRPFSDLPAVALKAVGESVAIKPPRVIYPCILMY